MVGKDEFVKRETLFYRLLLTIRLNDLTKSLETNNYILTLSFAI